MKLAYRTVDVFTDTRFCGNPLAVVLGADSLSDEAMQRIAREFNYSETSFVLVPERPGHTARVRIFTPALEVPFAGHPNIGTAHVLAAMPEHADADELVFEEKAGLVRIGIDRDADGTVLRTELTAPEPLATPAIWSVDEVAACLGLDTTDIATMVHPPLVASVGLPFVVAELASRAALARAKPVIDAITRSLPRDGADSIYVYTRDCGTADGGADFSARMFAPFDGLPEDPATGSATGAIAALLASRAGLADGEWHRSFAQGVDMGRPCRIEARVTLRAGRSEEVRIGGRSVDVMEGTIRI